MSALFEDFTRAASQSKTAAPKTARQFSRIVVLGGGADARQLAALCLAEGAEVTLFSAYGAELEMMRSSSGIGLRGTGPIGTYHVDREGTSIKTTAEIDGAVRGAEVIFLTGPVHKQRTYAMVLADHLNDGQVLVLAPGRSLGAVETAWMLRMGGCRADVTIVERQGLPYWMRVEGANLHLSAAGPQMIATLPSGRVDVIEGLAPFLTPSLVAGSVLESGFADLSGAVEIPALVLGGVALAKGGPEVPMGANPLPENNTMANLLGKDHRAVIETLAQERRKVAAAFGVRNLPQNAEWVAMYAGSTSGEGARPVPTTSQCPAILRDGVMGSLMPLISAAGVAGVDAPVTQSMVTLAETILGDTVATAGRRLETIGITSQNIDDARRRFDVILSGGL